MGLSGEKCQPFAEDARSRSAAPALAAPAPSEGLKASRSHPHFLLFPQEPPTALLKPKPSPHPGSSRLLPSLSPGCGFLHTPTGHCTPIPARHPSLPRVPASPLPLPGPLSTLPSTGKWNKPYQTILLLKTFQRPPVVLTIKSKPFTMAWWPCGLSSTQGQVCPTPLSLRPALWLPWLLSISQASHTCSPPSSSSSSFLLILQSWDPTRPPQRNLRSPRVPKHVLHHPPPPSRSLAGGRPTARL